MLDDKEFQRLAEKFYGFRGHTLTEQQYSYLRSIIDPMVIPARVAQDGQSKTL